MYFVNTFPSTLISLGSVLFPREKQQQPRWGISLCVLLDIAYIVRKVMTGRAERRETIPLRRGERETFTDFRRVVARFFFSRELFHAYSFCCSGFTYFCCRGAFHFYRGGAKGTFCCLYPFVIYYTMYFTVDIDFIVKIYNQSESS